MYIYRYIDTYIDTHTYTQIISIFLSKWNTERKDLTSKIDQNKLSLQQHLHNILTITL
jgi:hypothetical protein